MTMTQTQSTVSSRKPSTAKKTSRSTVSAPSVATSEAKGSAHFHAGTSAALHDHMREQDIARVAERYVSRVQKIARGMARQLPAHVDADDLAQAAMVGLMTALRAYDDSRDARLKDGMSSSLDAYLARRIRGAILDELRAIDPLSRDQRKDARQVQRATRKLEQQLGRAPAEDEVATAAGLDLDKVRAVREVVGATSPVALDDIGHVAGMFADPVEVLSMEEDRERLAGAIATLPEREQTILSLYFVEELSLKQIGQLLGVTESRICQLVSAATKKLRERLG
jgi:RNA polymerase sigma factor for flagellar operon FliA